MMFDFSLVHLSHSEANRELKQVLEAYEILKQGIAQKVDEVTRVAESAEFADEEQLNDVYQQRLDLYAYSEFFGVVMSYAVFEKFTMDVFNHSRLELLNVIADEKSPKYHELVKALRQLDIDLSRDPFDSAALNKFKGARDRIMHSLGQTLGRWDSSGKQWFPGESISLSDEYVYSCIGLVGITCEQIAEVYEQKAKAVGQDPKAIQ